MQYHPFIRINYKDFAWVLWVSWSGVLGLVGWSRVGSFVSWFVVVWLGVTVVLDISNESGVTIDFVGDGLNAAIGQQDSVRAGGNLAIAALLVTEVVVRRIVLDVVGKVVRAGWLLSSTVDKPISVIISFCEY